MAEGFAARDIGGQIFQGVPLRKGFVNLSGTDKVIRPRTVYCASDGDVVITWDDGTISTIAMVAGDAFPIDGAKQLTLSGATIHASGNSVE